VEFPVISVGAGLPGASPETMASAVATPLERQFGRIAGINQMTSVSQLLTLYTTPVVYLWFDRLAQRFSHLSIGNPIEEPGEVSPD
jgi:multidrug efflux pump subunit AcrB